MHYKEYLNLEHINNMCTKKEYLNLERLLPKGKWMLLIRTPFINKDLYRVDNPFSLCSIREGRLLTLVERPYNTTLKVIIWFSSSIIPMLDYNLLDNVILDFLQHTRGILSSELPLLKKK